MYDTLKCKVEPHFIHTEILGGIADEFDGEDICPETISQRTISLQLCTSPHAYERILAERLERRDPFVRYGRPIAWVDEDEDGQGTYSYTGPKLPTCPYMLQRHI